MTPEDFRPTREILFIERKMEDDKFEDSNLIKPDTHRNQMGLARVIAVGPEVKDISPGDNVYLGLLAGLKVLELKGPFFLVHQAEVLAVVQTT